MRRFSTKIGNHVKLALFATNPHFYWNVIDLSEEIHWFTFGILVKIRKVSYYDCFWIPNAQRLSQVVLKTEVQNFDNILYTRQTVWVLQYIQILLDFVLQILCNLQKSMCTRCIRYPGCSGFVQNLSLFEFLMKDNSIPDLPIWIKLGSALENIRLERHTNFGGKRFSKFHEIMVRSDWYQMTNVHPKSAWP